MLSLSSAEVKSLFILLLVSVIDFDWEYYPLPSNHFECLFRSFLYEKNASDYLNCNYRANPPLMATRLNLAAIMKVAPNDAFDWLFTNYSAKHHGRAAIFVWACLVL